MDTSAMLASSQVPIIGQPIKLLGYTLVASTQCQCSPGDPLQVGMQLSDGKVEVVRSTCPRCQSTYSIQTIAVNERGQLGLGFLMEAPAQA